MKSKKILLLVLLFLLYIVFPAPVYAAGPITGTWIQPFMWFGNEAEWRPFFDDMKEFGIDTIIYHILGATQKIPCQGGTVSLRLDYFESADRDLIPVIKLAKEYGMKMYFGGVDIAHGCMNHETSSTDHAILQTFTLQQTQKLKALFDEQGFDWNDSSLMTGFYITQEWQIPGGISYFNSLGNKLKIRYPGKEIIISPYKKDDTSATDIQALVQNATAVNIFAPQDSIGVGWVSFESNSQQFNALKTFVAQQPGKQAWANVETFEMHSGSTFGYRPASSFDRVERQIESARPYVSKLITWTYQDDFMSASVPVRNQTHTHFQPPETFMRQRLRDQYLQKYTTAIKVKSITIQNNNLVIKAEGFSQGTALAAVRVSYLLADNSAVKQHKATYTLTGNEEKTIEIPLAILPSYSQLEKSSVFLTAATEIPSTPGDLDADGDVDNEDWNTMKEDFGKTGNAGWIPADIIKDGKVDLFDYNILVGNFGE